MVNMPVRQFLLLLFLSVACPVAAQEEIGQAPVEDPIAERIEAAKKVYTSETLAAHESLLAAIDSEIEKTENRSGMSVEVQLKKLKELSDAREAYASDNGKLPSLSLLKSVTRRCERQLAASKRTMEKVFEAAADEYRKPPLKNFKAAAKTLADSKAFFKASVKKTTAKETSEQAPEPTIDSADLLSRKAWSIHYVDSAEHDRPATNVIDGDPHTHWITVWRRSVLPTYPHEIQIDLGEATAFGGLLYTPRQGNRTGRIERYKLYASQDGKTWGSPLAEGSFKSSSQQQIIPFEKSTAKFFRFVALSGFWDKNVATIGELGLLHPDAKSLLAELEGRGGSGFSPKFNAENWTVSDPKSVESKAGRLVIAAGANGNIVLTQKDDFVTPDAVVTLSAQAGTEAYLVVNARQEDGKWRGVTSPIRFENGRILAGGQSLNFRRSNSLRYTDDEKPLKFNASEDFELQLKLKVMTGNDERLLVVSGVNSKQTARLHYAKTWMGEAGAVGFFVRKGAIAVKKFELTTPEK